MMPISANIRDMGKSKDRKHLVGWGARIRSVRKNLGMSQTEFAQAVGTGQSTISRWEAEDDEPLAHNWDRMAELSGLSRSYIRYGELGDALATVPLKRLLVRGAVQAGAWREAMEWPEDDWKPFPVPAESARYPGIPLFGLEVRGNSMDEIFPEGTILGCINLIHNPVDITPGKYVIVQRINDTGEVEATVKEIHQDEEGTIWLVPRSTDPRHKAWIRADENGHVQIVALVATATRDY